MIIKLRRVLIASQFHPGCPRQPTPEEIRTIQLAWAEAAALLRKSSFLPKECN
jgi:hypothetical protein